MRKALSEIAKAEFPKRPEPDMSQFPGPTLEGGGGSLGLTKLSRGRGGTLAYPRPLGRYPR